MTDTLMADDIAPEGLGYFCDICGYEGKTARGVTMHKRTHGPAEPDDKTFADTLSPAETKLVHDLELCISMPTLMLMVANQVDGMLVMQGSPELCKQLVLLARKNKKLKRFLLMVIESAIWLGLATAVANIALPIMDNHGILSIPTFRVADKLGGQAARPSSPPAPSTGGGAPTAPRQPSAGGGGIVADAGGYGGPGMNRAARRAVETDPGPMPPGISSLLDKLGMTPEEAMEQARQLGIA